MSPLRLSLALKQSRLEVAIVGAAMLALAAATLWTAFEVEALHLEACVGDLAQVDCIDRLQTADDMAQTIKYLLLAGAGVPVFAAVALGIAVVAREIEQGTVMLAWSFSTSRRRWLASAAFALASAVVVLSAIPGATGSLLTAVVNPAIDPSNSMTDYALRGWIVPARALMVFAISVVVGMMVGRVLPGILLGVLAAALALAATGAVMDRFVGTQVQELPPSSAGDLVVAIRYRDPSGRLLTYEEAVQQLEPQGELPDGNFPLVRLGVPGTAHNTVEAVYVLVFLGEVLAATLAAALVVEKRRPVA